MNCDSIGGFPKLLKIRRWDDENGKVIIHNSPWTHSDNLPLPLEQHVFHSIHFCILPHRRFRERDENCQRQIRCVFQYFQFSQWVFSPVLGFIECDRAFRFFIYRFYSNANSLVIFLLIRRRTHKTLSTISWYSRWNILSKRGGESAIQCCSRNQFINNKEAVESPEHREKNEGKIGEKPAQHLPVSIHKMLMWCELVFDWFAIYGWTLAVGERRGGKARKWINAKCRYVLVDLSNCRHPPYTKR